MAEKKLYLKDLNTVVFMMRDSRWISIAMEEIEKYLDVSIIQISNTFDKD